MKNIEDINKAAIQKITANKKITEFSPGDTIKVGVKIVEGKRERIQYFEGVCIAKKNRDLNSSFTVRKISFGEGVERTFALYSPNVDSIKEESFENHLLEYPQYTKPREWEGKSPPEVLFSGDHAKIKGWRLSQSEAITRRQRPDLWKKYLEKKNEKH